MAEKKTKTKKPEAAKSHKKLDISPIAIVDNIVFSKTEAFAYFQITNSVYDFLSNDQKVSTALRISTAFNNLMSDKQESVDCHLIVTSIPVDVDAWAEQVLGVSSDWSTGPGFDRYVEEQMIYLKQQSFMKKVTYLGISLGKRGALDMSDINVLESGVKGAFDTFKGWVNSMLQTPTEAISAKEEDDVRRKEVEYYRTLSNGHLDAKRATTEDILLLIKRQFYPTMPTPYLDVDHENRVGPGDLALEVASAIENKYRWLKISQMVDDVEVSGYRAALTFAKFPKDMEYPGATFPFLYFPAKLSAPFTCYGRFTLHPSQKMKVELEKKKKEQKDEIDNLQAGQSHLDSVVDSTPADIVQSLDDIRHFETMLSQDKTPWVEGSFRIVIEAPTEENLREITSALKQRYDDLGILLQWTAGDQKTLFLEQMPGDYHRVKAFDQITNLNMISTSGMNFSSDVGDPIFGVDSE